MAQFLVSATHKSSGKTTISLGLCAALRRRGLAIQPFKKGPDYIDPMWLSAASGRTCFNLDFNTQSEAEIRSMFARRCANGDIAIIEGNNGLFDGTDIEGSNSNAAMAKVLGAPVILVVDCTGMTRGIAPLLMGYRAFDPDLVIGAVILNNVANDRHEAKLRAAVERYSDIPVLGAVRRNRDLHVTERHLGLVPTDEWGNSDSQQAAAADAMESQLDLDRLIAIARAAAPPALTPSPKPQARDAEIRIAIARDSAFGFYYADDLDAFRNAGVDLVAFDTLNDGNLPHADGLFIGGGFPETHLAALEANKPLRQAIRRAIEGGLPTYAECGGLMYLARSVEWQGHKGEMVGVIPADIAVHDRPRGHGYVQLTETESAPWPTDPDTPAEIQAHEFHYSDIRKLDGTPVFAYQMKRGYGIDGRHDGLVRYNLLAAYSHLRNTGGNQWVRRFLAFVRACNAAS